MYKKTELRYARVDGFFFEVWIASSTISPFKPTRFQEHTGNGDVFILFNVHAEAATLFRWNIWLLPMVDVMKHYMPNEERFPPVRRSPFLALSVQISFPI